MANKILVIEDDTSTSDFISRGLTEEGFAVDCVDNGRDGLFHAIDDSYDCIVLDRMMPGMDGLTALAGMRAAGVETPVIVLSALDSTEDRIKGLTNGSDDYLTKPFAFAELLARIRLLMRRGTAREAVQTILQCENLEMDLLSRRVKRDERKIDLQPREFRLLEFLLRHAEQVVTRTMLLEGVWDYHFDPGTNVIDVHLSKLRKKIDEGADRPLIHTVRGVGYRLGRTP